MASLVRLYLHSAADRVMTSWQFDHPARVLQLLSHEGAVRRDRTQHLQTLPNFRKCDVDYLTRRHFTVILITPVGMNRLQSRKYHNGLNDGPSNGKAVVPYQFELEFRPLRPLYHSEFPQSQRPFSISWYRSPTI